MTGSFGTTTEEDERGTRPGLWEALGVKQRKPGVEFPTHSHSGGCHEGPEWHSLPGLLVVSHIKWKTKKSLKSWASLLAQTVKNPPAMQEIWVRSLGCKDPLEKGMATHSSISASRISMDRGAWLTMGSQRVRDNWATTLSLSLEKRKDFIIYSEMKKASCKTPCVFCLHFVLENICMHVYIFNTKCLHSQERAWGWWERRKWHLLLLTWPLSLYFIITYFILQNHFPPENYNMSHTEVTHVWFQIWNNYMKQKQVKFILIYII